MPDRRPTGLPEVWRTETAELTDAYPCDRYAAQPSESWFRGITVDAPVPVVYRWLCQLKVAPYSYDLLDNLGRTSPRTPTPGADRLAVGQTVMTIYTQDDFSTDDHLTNDLTEPTGLRVYCGFTLTYRVRPLDGERTRLVVKLRVAESGGALAALRRRAIAWGDLGMMRKQLRTLAELAETPAVDDGR